MKKEKSKTNWSKETDESVLDYLRRILDANWIQVILAFLTLIVAILSLYVACGGNNSSKDDDEVIDVDEAIIAEESVLKHLADIESTIKLEDIPTNIDSVNHPDLQLIKTFKLLYLDFANKTRELYNTPSVSKFETNSFEDFLTIEKSWDARMGSRRECMEKIQKVIEEIDSYGKEHNIENYLINHAIYNDFLEAEKKVDKYSDKCRDQALEIYNRNNADFSESNKDEFLKIVKLQEESCKNIYIYKRDNKLLEYLHFLNKNYDMQLKIILNS